MPGGKLSLSIIYGLGGKARMAYSGGALFQAVAPGAHRILFQWAVNFHPVAIVEALLQFAGLAEYTNSLPGQVNFRKLLQNVGCGDGLFSLAAVR